MGNKTQHAKGAVLLSLFRRLEQCMPVLVGAVFFGSALAALGSAQAQEVSFTPRYDAIDNSANKIPRRVETPHSTKRSPSYSFVHLSSVCKDLCEGLRGDHRDTRVFEVTSAGLKQDAQCPACRALYRQIQGACRPKPTPKVKKIKQITPVPTPTETPVPEDKELGENGASEEDESADSTSVGEEEDSAETRNETETGEGQAEEAEERSSAQTREVEDVGETPPLSPTPSPTATPQPARYPSTEVVDALSRFSTGLYDVEPGFGEVLAAVQGFTRRLLDGKDFTNAERDYYGIFSSYLLSAWEGRPNSPLDPKVRAEEDVSELFQ